MRIGSIIAIVALILGCNQGNKEDFNSANPFLEPIEFDSIVKSIDDRLIFPDHDTIKYLPIDRDASLQFEFSGKMKELMKYGKMIVRPIDSSVMVKRIDNHTFKLKANKPIDDWKIMMYYEISFHDPYFLTYIMDNEKIKVAPNDTILLFARSFMTKPGKPWDYIDQQ